MHTALSFLQGGGSGISYIALLVLAVGVTVAIYLSRRSALKRGDSDLIFNSPNATNEPTFRPIAQSPSGARTFADVVGRLIWGATLLSAGLAFLNFWTTRAAHSEASAPQIAALAAESLTMALIPYAIARAWDELFRPVQR